MGLGPGACSAALVLGAATFAASGALAQNLCGVLSSNAPVIQPVIYSDTHFDENDDGFACQMWQAFIFLNWPARTDQRGVPDRNAQFGGPGTTVWETYKTNEQVFLPNGQNPGPWFRVAPGAMLHNSLAAYVANGSMRNLTLRSKVSRDVLANLARDAAVPPDILHTIQQAAGGILYDLNGNPVFYEVAMNTDQYAYVVRNGLYDARTQAAFARTQVIRLPAGSTDYGTTGTVTVKAAWKILSPAEIRSGRFHTRQALIDGRSPPRTVGLVGLHVFQLLPRFWQGAWATFAQIDNAPLQGGPIAGPYNFYNPGCAGCPINVANRNPGQVEQIVADDSSAAKVTGYMQDAIKQYNPSAPWQYYKLVTVQWPQQAVDLRTLQAPVSPPLPAGSPNHDLALNAVLETFVQGQRRSCLACHIGATIAAGGQASSYSFTFGHAKAP